MPFVICKIRLQLWSSINVSQQRMNNNPLASIQQCQQLDNKDPQPRNLARCVATLQSMTRSDEHFQWRTLLQDAEKACAAQNENLSQAEIAQELAPLQMNAELSQAS